MSERGGVRDKTAGPQELAEAAGALQHISRVMGRVQERLGNFAAVGIWWGALTAMNTAPDINS